MKITALLLFFFLPFVAIAQDDAEARAHIDSLVSVIDSNHAKLTTFTTTGKSGNSKKMVFKYRFKYNNGQLAYVVREFSDKDSSTKQLFYVIGSTLIYSSEFITYYYGKDWIVWGGTYYFSKGKLIYEETLGHGKSELDWWDPEKEVLNNYWKARIDIAAYLKGRKEN